MKPKKKVLDGKKNLGFTQVSIGVHIQLVTCYLSTLTSDSGNFDTYKKSG